MADNNEVLLPLGYRTSPELLRNYGYRHGLQRTKASMIVGETSEEEIVDEATVVFFALIRAKAEHVDWVASTDAEGNDVTYIQVSGGGKPEFEWRIAESVEKRICEELEITEEPVRFRPENWIPPSPPRIGRDRD
jgi:hypothetical protein